MTALDSLGFDEEQRDYMVNRSINLLLSHFQKAEDPVQFYGASDQEKLRTVFSVMYLRRFLDLSKFFYNLILPEVLRRLANQSSRLEQTYQLEVRGNIDWQKTILLQFSDSDGFVCWDRFREYLNPENTLLALTVIETGAHAQDLYDFFKEERFAPERQILEKVRKLSRVASENVYLKDNLQDAISIFRPERNFLRNKLLADSSTEVGKTYQSFSKQAEKVILRKRISNRAYLELLSWRKNYSNSVGGLASFRATQFEREWTGDLLFEIWAFCEVLYAFQKSGKKLEPIHAMYEERKKPLYELGRSLVYYNTTMKKESAERDEDEDTQEFSRKFVRGSRPDMMIVNQQSPADSIIIDMKNLVDPSSTAYLKVLGYTKNYGVNNGIVIFSSEIAKQDLVNSTAESDRLVRTTRDQYNFVTVSMEPGKAHEALNEETLKKLSGILGEFI